MARKQLGANPAGSTDDVTKLYVDTLGMLKPVRVADTGLETFTISGGNVTQIAGTTITGVSVNVGDRVLIQSAPASSGTGSYGSNQPGNGIYTVTGNTTNISLTRASDMSGSVKPGGLSVAFGQFGAVFTVAKPIDPTSSVTYGTTSIQWYRTGNVLAATLDDVQTLTNKTISGTNNAITSVSSEVLPVRVAAEQGLTMTVSGGNVTQINGTTIDGVTVATGDRVLVIGAPATTGASLNHSNQPGNGIYVVTNSTTNLTLSRSPDMSGSVVPWGFSVYIREGSGTDSWGGYKVNFNGVGAFTWGSTPLSYTGYIAIDGEYVDSFVDANKLQTLTNKWLQPRVTVIISSATPAINTDTCDFVTITTLATAITSMTSSLTGTPINFQKLWIRIKDDGTARAITWGANFISSGTATLPTTTVATKTHEIGFIYNSVSAKWVCVAVDATGY